MKRLTWIWLLLIVAGALPVAAVTVTAPGGGTLTVDTDFVIRWTHSSNLTAASLARLLLFRGSVKVGEIASNIPITQKSYNWKVGRYIGGTAFAASDYKIRLKAMDGSYTDDGGAFAIQAGSGSGPSLTVTRPAAGEVLLPGRTATIAWTRSGAMSDKVNIFLEYGMMMKGLPIAEQAPNTGSFTWTVPFQVPPLSKLPAYRIYVQCWNPAANKWVHDSSEDFRIAPTIQAHHRDTFTIPARTANARRIIFHDEGHNGSAPQPEVESDPGPGNAWFGFQNFPHPEKKYYYQVLYRSWVYFDLSSLPQGRIPIRCEIKRLKSYSGYGEHNMCGNLAYQLNAPFNGDPNSLFTTQSYSNQHISLWGNDDLLQVLKSWLADPGYNYGMMTAGTGMSGPDPWQNYGCVWGYDNVTLEVVY